MLKIENLSYSYPEKELYKNISFTLEDGQHCAFIGTNGTGKSTLIDIIRNPKEFMFDGTLEMSSNWKIGYVSQFIDLDKEEDITVFEYLGAEFIRLQNEITDICTKMETAQDIEPLLEKYQDTLDMFNSINGDNYENTIERNLNLANLSSYKDLKVNELSGGEFKLIQVIKSMLNSPDLIIMDEPDVFLDFENLNSLKNLINSHKGAMLVITHNRYLLNNCFNKIIHLENKELQEFDGNYIDYNFSLLEAKIELQELAAADTAEIERNEKLINKLRVLATENAESFRGRTLNARVKIQERLEKRRIKAPFVELKEPVIEFETENYLEEDSIALEACNLNLSFDEVLLENVEFEIKATDKVAIIGANGTGKTTLLKELFKNDNEGIKVNEDIDMAYFSQLQDQTLNIENTVVQEFYDAGVETYDEVLEHLLNYGFTEDILPQKINELSGGEKNMLQLAKIALSDANMLLLDEPTSHLDTYSQVALEKALKEYNGAILMISHDFYTIVNCMDYVLLVEDKTVRRVRMRKFRKMIYENHFDKNYLEFEQTKKQIETKIEQALRNNDFELAKTFAGELEPLIKQF